MNIQLLQQEFEKTGMTVTNVAKLSNCSKSTISRLFKNEIKPNVDTARDVSKALGLSKENALRIFFDM